MWHIFHAPNILKSLTVTLVTCFEGSHEVSIQLTNISNDLVTLPLFSNIGTVTYSTVPGATYHQKVDDTCLPLYDDPHPYLGKGECIDTTNGNIVTFKTVTEEKNDDDKNGNDVELQSSLHAVNTENESTITSTNNKDTQQSTPLVHSTYTNDAVEIPSLLHLSYKNLPHWLNHLSRITFWIPDTKIFNKSLFHTTKNSNIFVILVGRSKSSSVKYHFSKEEIVELINKENIMSGHKPIITKPKRKQREQQPPPTLELNTWHAHPLVHPVDLAIPSMADKVSFTHDQLRKAFRFCNIDNFLPLLRKKVMDNFSVSTSNQEPTLNLGEVATADRPKCNTSPLDLPSKFGDSFHMNIVFGSRVAITRVK